MNLLMMNMMVEKNKKKYCCDRYLPLKKEKCAYEKVQAKNILEKKHRQGMKGRKQPSRDSWSWRPIRSSWKLVNEQWNRSWTGI